MSYNCFNANRSRDIPQWPQTSIYCADRRETRINETDSFSIVRIVSLCIYEKAWTLMWSLVFACLWDSGGIAYVVIGRAIDLIPIGIGSLRVGLYRNDNYDNFCQILGQIPRPQYSNTKCFNFVEQTITYWDFTGRLNWYGIIGKSPLILIYIFRSNGNRITTWNIILSCRLNILPL